MCLTLLQQQTNIRAIRNKKLISGMFLFQIPKHNKDDYNSWEYEKKGFVWFVEHMDDYKEPRHEINLYILE